MAQGTEISTVTLTQTRPALFCHCSCSCGRRGFEDSEFQLPIEPACKLKDQKAFGMGKENDE